MHLSLTCPWLVTQVGSAHRLYEVLLVRQAWTQLVRAALQARHRHSSPLHASSPHSCTTTFLKMGIRSVRGLPGQFEVSASCYLRQDLHEACSRQQIQMPCSKHLAVRRAAMV